MLLPLLAPVSSLRSLLKVVGSSVLISDGFRGVLLPPLPTQANKRVTEPLWVLKSHGVALSRWTLSIFSSGKENST